jgi:isoamylase
MNNVLALRRDRPALRREAFYTDEDIQWFDPRGRGPDWSDTRSRSLACLIRDDDGPALFLMFNADSEPVDFALPVLPRSGRWWVAVDTAEPSPGDSHATGEEGAVVNQASYAAGSHSSAVLVAR